MARNHQSVTEIAEEAGRIEEIVEDTVEKGRKTWNTVRNRGEELLEEVRERGGESWDDAQKLVKKYPGRSIGLALLAGAVFGALLIRNNDK